jgi:hypothetical protein
MRISSETKREEVIIKGKAVPSHVKQHRGEEEV